MKTIVFTFLSFMSIAAFARDCEPNKEKETNVYQVTDAQNKPMANVIINAEFAESNAVAAPFTISPSIDCRGKYKRSSRKLEAFDVYDYGQNETCSDKLSVYKTGIITIYYQNKITPDNDVMSEPKSATRLLKISDYCVKK